MDVKKILFLLFLGSCASGPMSYGTCNHVDSISMDDGFLSTDLMDRYRVTVHNGFDRPVTHWIRCDGEELRVVELPARSHVRFTVQFPKFKQNGFVFPKSHMCAVTKTEFH